MSDQPYQTFHLSRQVPGILVVTFDVPGQTQNVFNQQLLGELGSLLGTLKGDQTVKGILFQSAKPTSFFAGADIREFSTVSTALEAQEVSRQGQELFARIEELAIPTVAAIHGACFGGGLEFALACKYRIAWDEPKTRMGLPEITLGILPAWGGTQRLPRKIGLIKGMRLILEGKRITAQEALAIGLIEQVVTGTLDKFREVSLKLTSTLLNGLKPVSYAPERKRTWLTWFLERTSFGRVAVFKNARQEISSKSEIYPAFEAAVRAIEIGLVQGLAAGYKHEQLALGQLMTSPTSQNLVRIFLQNERAKSGKDWKEVMHDDEAKTKSIDKIGVIGGGIMGGGIAQLAAQQGVSVVIKEVNDELANKSKITISAALEGLVTKRRLLPQQKQETMQRLSFTTKWEELRESDLVVEAVPEIPELKQEVFKQLEGVVKEETILVTNTSALSVENMQQVLTDKSRFGGWHFFNPVHRMPLVEIIKTPATSEQTISLLIDITKKLGKTPIVVQDSPGFLVNRILMPYLDEAIRLVCEGENVQLIDTQMRQFGMPMGPLELLDQIGLDVGAHVANAMKDVFSEGSPTGPVLSAMVKDGKLGRKSNVGFYQYPVTDDPKLKPTPVSLDGYIISTHSSSSSMSGMRLSMSQETHVKLKKDLTVIQSRLICSMINEAVKCLDEGVVAEPWMVDLAMVLGTGFPGHLGGPLRLADTLGVKQIHDLMRSFIIKHGEHFEPASGLKNRALKNEPFFAGNSPGFWG
jgi:3-hydroxyacyl-CoA dehydrogenase/enoyl-CoA hydratase/3-hydroxybutyryl-CoA epimerase